MMLRRFESSESPESPAPSTSNINTHIQSRRSFVMTSTAACMLAAEATFSPLIPDDSTSVEISDALDELPTDQWLIEKMLSGLQFDDIVGIFKGYGDQFAARYPENYKYTIALARYTQSYSPEELRDIHAEFIATLKRRSDQECKDNKVKSFYQKRMIDIFVTQNVCAEKLSMLRLLNDESPNHLRISLEKVLAERRTEEQSQKFAMNTAK